MEATVSFIFASVNVTEFTFVSIMSAGGVPAEEVARMAGYKQTSTTELVYRCELRPVVTTGAEV